MGLCTACPADKGVLPRQSQRGRSLLTVGMDDIFIRLFNDVFAHPASVAGGLRRGTGPVDRFKKPTVIGASEGDSHRMESMEDPQELTWRHRRRRFEHKVAPPRRFSVRFG